jgi:hypothetical protein
MKPKHIATVVLLAAAIAAHAEEPKPRVLVKAMSPIATELMQWLGEKCPSVLVTSRESAAQYVLMMDPGERKGVQFVILQSNGDMLKGGAAHTIKGGGKDACRIIETDWSEKNTTPRPVPPPRSTPQPHS